MISPDKKSQELDARSIMQGLEEFATFMSYSGDCGSVRILSVETAQYTELPHNRKRPRALKTTQLSRRKIAL